MTTRIQEIREQQRVYYKNDVYDFGSGTCSDVMYENIRFLLDYIEKMEKALEGSCEHFEYMAKHCVKSDVQYCEKPETWKKLAGIE